MSQTGNDGLDEAEIIDLFQRFERANPAPKSELVAPNAFTFLVAVVLSAQATDVGVNKATPVLFALADTPAKMAALGEDRVRDCIKTIGFYRAKARNIVGLARRLVDVYGGEVPDAIEDLETLPGVGRKTARVLLNSIYGAPFIAVDTHVFRVANRLPLVRGKMPLDVELGLERIVPSRFKSHAHHWLLLHGRYTCKARKPACGRCLAVDLCRWPNQDLTQKA